MKLLTLVFVLLTAAFTPQAKKEAEVTVGNARFTVLTPRLIRMEWVADGKFEDRATLGIVNRDLPLPAFKVSKSSSKVVIRTDALTLTYRNTGKFTAQNLSVTFNMADPSSRKGVKKVTWQPGMDESGNLLGTKRTLDQFDAIHENAPYDKGVASRDGWAVLDESNRQVLVPVDEDWQYWVENRPEGERQDIYLFAYGHDYMQAVSDFTKVGGRIPLPPKYAFGYWWCRYWQYSDFELRDLARHFRDFSIPIDVMVIDMDWHETWADLRIKHNNRDQAGEYLGWTGYTWKKELFPNPKNLLTDLHNFGVKTSLNLHFQSGIQPFEEPYDRFVKDYVSRTSDYDGPEGYKNPDGSPAYVPYRMSQMEWADSYFKTVIRPFEEQGVDFWWMDWQQWLESRYVSGLNNTFWLNYAFFNDKVRQSASMGKEAPRPMIYHRWGGIGSHRYQIGFSGDTYATWRVLGALPQFTATASNVGYGYWGHDIGGHMQPSGVKFTDPELYTRWLQEGVFTPIYKTHSTKDMSMEKRFWVFPEHFDAMREAVRLRYDLTPYIYTAAREAYDTGISLCRPLYYYFPEEENAYTCNQEFFFGADILATVIDRPVDKTTALAEREMWFPAGNDWYDVATGSMYKGGTTEKLSYTVSENPWYIKAGAVIPLAGKDIKSLQEASNEIRFFVAPGDGESEARVYEDDGTTQAYEDEYAVTRVRKVSSADRLSLKVAAREGSYKGMPDGRRVSVILEGVIAPAKVTVNGKPVEYARFCREGDYWTYDGNDLAATIVLAERSAGTELDIEVSYSEEAAANRNLVFGRKGLIHRFMTLTEESKYVFDTYVEHDRQTSPAFLNIAQCGSYISENPFGEVELLKAIDTAAMNDELAGIAGIPEAFRTKCKAQAEL